MYTEHVCIMRADLQQVCVIVMAYGCKVNRAVLAVEPSPGQVWVSIEAKSAVLRDTIASDLKELGLIP